MPLKSNQQAEQVAQMQRICHKVITATKKRSSPLQHLPGLVRYALAGKPLEYKFEHSDELVQKIQHVTATVDFDIIHIEPSYVGLYLEAISPNTQCKKFLTFHNIESSLFKRLSQVEREPIAKLRTRLHSLLLKRWEANYTKQYDHCITVSELDRQLLLAANPNLQITVSPNGVDTKQYRLLPPSNKTPSLVFVGSMNYSACVDAMLYFCREILPLIRRQIKDIEVWIVGRDPVPEIKAMEGNGVHVTGWIDDVQPYYSQSTICIVPLRAGGGTRLKILEAMALGRPVVSTSIGCEGLDVVDGEHIFIADTPQAFATKTIRLLEETALREKMICQARQLVEDRYDWDSITQSLLQLYGAIINNVDSKFLPERLIAHQKEAEIYECQR